MTSIQSSAKAAHLLSYVNLDRPELAAVQSAADPATALVDHLAAQTRARFRFEYARKAEMLDFLRAHYGAWRAFDTRKADRFATMTIEEAQGPRALSAIAETGKAWWATGDPRYGETFQRFYLRTATGEMFNWGSFNGMQGALELDAYFLLLDCPGFSVDGRVAFLDHLCAITDFAWDHETARWRQLMLGTEGHNWYLHGMHVLPFFGLLFPEFNRADFFTRSGMSVVEEHMRGHIKSDGGMRETCIGYQAGSMLNLWDFYVIAHRNGWPLSSDFADRLLMATHFLLNLMSPVGGLPSFGDGGHTPGGLTELAAVAAALTGDRECKWHAEQCRQQRAGTCDETPGVIPESAFWAVGLEGAATYAATRARDPHARSMLFGATGYAALRDSGQPDARYLAIAAADRGPVVTSHGHNDIFALDVLANGVRFLGEMGCAPYGETPGRDYDQLTEAHTTLGIAGMEQTPLASEWRWTGRTIPAVRRWISEDTHDFFHGAHEGYYQYRVHETMHARKVFFVKTDPAYWVVLDWLESTPENDYCANFHGCVPGRLDGNTVWLGEDAGPQLAIIQPDGDTMHVARISSAGLEAYIRERNLDAERYPCFVYSKHAASDCLAWVLAPLAAGAPAPRVRRLPVTLNGDAVDPYGAIALEIAFTDCTDTLCLSHRDYDADLAFGDQQVWGFLAYRRSLANGTTALSFTHTMADGVCGR